MGDSGIPIRDGRTLPFVVTRGWNAPSGYYPEAFYLVNSAGEVLFEGPPVTRLIWGLQSVTDVEQQVREPISLTPGTYRLVFMLGDKVGAEATVEAFEAPAEAAA
jgi:hypothetical protein